MTIFKLSAYFNSTQKVDVFNVTHDVKRALRESKALDGLLVVYLPGSTAGVKVLENDPKIHEAYKDLIISIVADDEQGLRPKRKSGSGALEAHLKASLLTNSLTIPIEKGKLLLGPWQEVIVFDFDDKIGRREVFIQVLNQQT